MNSLNQAASGKPVPARRDARPTLVAAICIAALAVGAPGTARALDGLSEPSVTPPQSTAPEPAPRSSPNAIGAADSDPSPTPDLTVRGYTGEQIPNDATGADYASFFTPETGAFLCVATPTFGTGSVLKIGGLLSAFPNAVIEGLTQPSGLAMYGIFKPGIGGLSSKDNVAMLFGDLADLTDVEAVAQTGLATNGLPTGVSFKQFLTLDGNGFVADDPFFFAILQGAHVTAGNSLALCTFNPDGDGQSGIVKNAEAAATVSPGPLGPVLVLLRKGGSVDVDGTPKPVKVITTLVGSQGTLAQGRWRCQFTEEDTIKHPDIFPEVANNWIGARFTFTDNSEGIFAIPGFDNDTEDWIFLERTGPGGAEEAGLDNATITSFGLPAFAFEQFAVLASLAPDNIGAIVKATQGVSPATEEAVTAANNLVLINGYEYSEPFVLARKGDAVTEDANGDTLTGVTIAGMGDPVAGGTDGGVAFMVTLAGLLGGNTGIMYAPDGYPDTLGLLANAGAEAPGGGHWASFISLVLPQDFESFALGVAAGNASPSEAPEFQFQGGPIFTATLEISGTDGVTSANNFGLWGVDGFGDFELLFRTGQTVTVNAIPKTVKSFVALASAPGSVGAASSYDNDGNVAVVATFTDGTTALLNIALPLQDEFIP